MINLEVQEAVYDMLSTLALAHGQFGKPQRILDPIPLVQLAEGLDTARREQLVHFVRTRGVDPYHLKVLVDAGLGLETYFQWVDNDLHPAVPSVVLADSLAQVAPQMRAQAAPQVAGKVVAVLNSLIEGKAKQ